MRPRLRQLGFEFRTWGGARPGAGRKPNGRKALVSHLARPSHSRQHPLHVTLRIQRGLPSLRQHSLFGAVQNALAKAKQRFGFGLVHFSVQRDHLHLIAEAHDRRALSRGIQGLSIRVARAVNARLQRNGKLFADRYHARALTTPRAAHFAVRYVLLNARKHSRKAAAKAPGSAARSGSAAPHDAPAGFIDACSSAAWFRPFRRPEALVFGASAARAEWRRRSGSSEPPVTAAKTWLLRTAQRFHGFDVDEIPGGS